MKTVSVAEAVIAEEAVLLARVQEALGELVGVAKEGSHGGSPSTRPKSRPSPTCSTPAGARAEARASSSPGSPAGHALVVRLAG